MKFVDLNANVRTETGKEANKKLRDINMVPAIVYRKGEDTLNLKIDMKDLYKALHTDAGENAVIKIKIDGVQKNDERTVVVKEIQRHPIKDKLIHVDFQEISLTETLQVKVPIVAKGEAIGVKRDKGVLQHILWEAEIECLPSNIPEKIEVDVSNLEIGSAIHLKDIQHSEDIKFIDDPEAVVFSVEHAKEMEEVTAEAVEGESQEPEVIREKKEKEEEEPEEKSKESEEDKK